jgi:glycosyltransferase involved in cell wall biosynthesis
MKVSGFTFVRNGVMLDYPFLESIQSLLPLCDEVTIAVGNSTDNTLAQIQSLQSPKLRILHTLWDETLRKDGMILSQQTNVALDHASGDWAIYLQADEILHEKDYSIIRDAMGQYKEMTEVEGLLFTYMHFYGNYNYIGISRRWYQREIRIVRPNTGIRSWGDAQGFRVSGKKLRVKLINATIYHYGWVKPPEIQQLKQRTFDKLWHSDEWVKQRHTESIEYDYSQGGKLQLFEGTHPSVMMNRIRHQSWQFRYDEKKVQQSVKEKVLQSIEACCGWRIGEYKNYQLI